MVAHLMNESVKGALLGASFGGVIWLCTGMWQFFAVALVGVLCTWAFTSAPDHAQPRRRVREFVRVEIRDVERLRACYDYGGCQWAGDGCAGRPVVLGPGEGCEHTRTQAWSGKRVPDERDALRNRLTCTSSCLTSGCPRDLLANDGCGVRKRDLRVRPSDCTCDDVPCVCSPRNTRRGHLPWG